MGELSKMSAKMTRFSNLEFLKRELNTSGAAILFCLVAVQRSVLDSESTPNIVAKRHEALLVTYRCIVKRYKAQLTHGSGLPLPTQPCTSLYPLPARPTWPFQFPYGIRNSDPGILAVTARSWSKNRSLISSVSPLWGSYTDRKITQAGRL